ncbi:MAG TPA: pilus assembly protein [Rhodanobacteraceae bacterium]|nr:pilus assembly protein [Rhodanobacteraceae bacterium]
MFVHRIQPRFPQRARERGAVLLVALIFLILLTLLAIGASSGSLLQQRMVAATRSAQLASLSADTALRGAEWRIWNTSSVVGGTLQCDVTAINATSGCVKYDPESPLYATGGAVAQFRTGNNAWLSTGIAYTGLPGASNDFTNVPIPSNGYTASANVADNPRYIIEDMGLVTPPGAGTQHESGVTGPNSGGAGHINIHIYRITARATGGTSNTVRVVQSTFDAQTSN